MGGHQETVDVSPVSRRWRNAPIVLAGFFLLLGSAANAEEQAVETVTVTAAHVPEAVGSAAFSVVTLDRRALSKFDRLDTALEEVPGLSLFRRSDSMSANPTIQGVSLRDIAPSAASRALVLLDGVPMNDPFGGWVIWGALPHEDIDSAEIVRGAGAGPYGAGALTGTIALSERENVDGVATGDASGGSLGTWRAGASGGASVGGLALFASAADERSDGWIPVDAEQRGPADTDVWLHSGSLSLRGETEFAGIEAAARVGYYDTAQGSGLLGGNAKTDGLTASLSLAGSVNEEIGWRVQGWLFHSDLSNISIAVSTPTGQPDRSVATPSNDQYATPALGVGMNAALVGSAGHFHWEAGADLRDDSGHSHELYSFSNGAYQSGRVSGGQSLVGGLYGEGAYDLDAWLLTAGARVDEWATSQGHLLQYALPNDATTLDKNYPGRSGTVPTARAGARRSIFGDEYLRFAAYAGFRTPTLNELYRPFRVGSVVTNANADLTPEKLYGAEAGWGGGMDRFTWEVTGFWNQLHNAIVNVTVDPATHCPGQTGIICEQRQNVGDIDALGLEGEATEKLGDAFALRGAISLTDARVHGGSADPALDGKRPAQAPRIVSTAGAVWFPFPDWRFDGDVRWVGAQFEDDRNTLRLGSAFVADLRAEWQFRENLSFFAAVDNVADARVNTGETSFEPASGIGGPAPCAPGVPGCVPVASIGAPRTFEVGLTYAP